MYIARKIVLIFTVFLFIYLVSIAIFGTKGCLVNNSLKSEINRINKIIDKNEITEDSIKEEIANAKDEDNLNDIAFSLGYKSKGSQVYYFDSPDEVVILDVEDGSTDSQISFRGIENYILAIISFVLAALISLLILKIEKKKRKTIDNGIYEGDYNDYSNY